MACAATSICCGGVGVGHRVDVRGVLRPDHELRLRRPARVHVLGELDGFADVVVQHRAPLAVEVQAQPRHVALDHRDRDGGLVAGPGAAAHLRCGQRGGQQHRGDAQPGTSRRHGRASRSCRGRCAATSARSRPPARTTTFPAGRSRRTAAAPRPTGPATGTARGSDRNRPHPRGIHRRGHSTSATPASTHSSASHSGQPGSLRTTTANIPNTRGNKASARPASATGPAPTSPLIHGSSGM